MKQTLSMEGDTMSNKKHYAERKPIDLRVIYKCTCAPPSDKCAGFTPAEGDKGRMFVCKHKVLGAYLEPWCSSPPSVPCPKSPYRPQDPSTASRARDFDVTADTYKWLLEEYCAPGKERDDLVVILDELVRQSSKLAKKSQGGIPNRYDTPFK